MTITKANKKDLQVQALAQIKALFDFLAELEKDKHEVREFSSLADRAFGHCNSVIDYTRNQS